MKKLFLLLLGICLITSCQKKKSDAPVVKQTVTFGVQEISSSSLKSESGTWNCSSTIPDMAWIQVDGKDYYAHLTTVNGQLYSQSIKLTPGTHIVNHFVLYKETDGIEGITGNDEVVYGIPETGSEFALYVNRTVEFPIEVLPFAKTEVPVQVLCFNDSRYLEFGFNWFAVNRTIVREQCFFGDICLENYKEYAGSDYEKQSTGLALDMPAIFKIMAYKQQPDGSWALLANGGIFTNDNAETSWGVGTPVCVQYPDNLSAVDNFKFELYILVKQGDNFNFVLSHTWTFKDAEMIPTGGDGIVDFELGNCNAGSVDLQLPLNQNLPATNFP